VGVLEYLEVRWDIINIFSSAYTTYNLINGPLEAVVYNVYKENNIYMRHGDIKYPYD